MPVNQNWEAKLILRAGLILLLSMQAGNAAARLTEHLVSQTTISDSFIIANVLALACAVGGMGILFARNLLTKHPFWLVILVGLLLTAFNLDAVITLLQDSDPQLGTPRFYGVVISSISFQGMMIFLAGWLTHQAKQSFTTTFGLRQGKALRVIGYGVLFALLALMFEAVYMEIIARSGHKITEQEVVRIIRSSSSLSTQAYLAFFATVLAPVGEELFFRRIIYPTIRARLGITLAVILTSGIFAAFHFSPAATLVPLFFLSVGLALAYECTGNILTSILTHSLFNLANFAAILLSDGTKP